ncbi:L,D-transpeptidase [Aureimonas sp. AU12]|uniref:L,D-transpeptidase n=1 Tax=Aureimonas sp. AU12 TaxID=1638161 RepID=UPI0007833598|nr:L,D-transpeptidase [Aureimonas sp. AU12]
MRLRFPLTVVTLALLAAAPAGARDRQPLSVPAEIAAPWVEQLSPGSGVVPGYARQRVARPYPPGRVVFDGNVPVGIAPADGGPIEPLGSYREEPRPVLGFFGEPRRRDERAPRPRASRRTPLFASAAIAPAAPAARAGVRSTQPRHEMDPVFLPQRVAYRSAHAPGTIVIDTRAKFLYRVEADGQAMRYGVGVGKEGFGWTGSHRISRKAEWPGWTPPAEMRVRERAKGRVLPAHMPGGVENPLGARALYLGSTLYRIHGTNAPWTIGQSVSSGCIRMRNEDVVDLYEHTDVGTRVIVM